MNFTLLKHEMLAIIKLFSIILAVLMLYIISIVYMYDPEMSNTLNIL